MNMSDEHTPWYRQFWPWFIIALPLSVVIAGITTVVIAIERADTLVVDDYYKEGLAINQQLDKLRRAADLGVHAQLSIDRTVGELRLVVMPTDVANDTLQLRIAHPMDSAKDERVTLRRGSDGIFRGAFEYAFNTRRYLQLDDDHQGWRLTAELMPAEPTVELTPDEL